jgi:hypothetical protein
MASKKLTDNKEVKGSKLVKEDIDEEVNTEETEPFEPLKDNNLEQVILGWLKNNYKNYGLNYDGGNWFGEYYADYNDTIELSVLANKYNKYSRGMTGEEFTDKLYEYLDDVYSYSSLTDELSPIVEDIKKYFDSQNITHTDDDVWKVVSENIYINPPYEHFFEQNYPCEIFIDTGDSNTEYVENAYADDVLKTVDDIPDTASLVWLAKTQGYTKEDLFNAIINSDFKNSEFLKSVQEEVYNCSSSIGQLVFLVEMSINDVINKSQFVVSTRTDCGLVDTANGGGSVLGIILEKPVTITRDIGYVEFDYTVDYDYSVDDIYGGVGHTPLTESKKIKCTYPVNEKLIKGKSKKTLQKNIKTEIEAGKYPKQAAAIAYDIQRKAMDEDYNTNYMGDLADKLLSEIKEATNDYKAKEGNFTIFGPQNKDTAVMALESYYNKVDSEKVEDSNEWTVTFSEHKTEQEMKEDKEDMEKPEVKEKPTNVIDTSLVGEQVDKIETPITEDSDIDSLELDETNTDEQPEVDEQSSNDERAKTEILQLLRAGIKSEYDTIELYENQMLHLTDAVQYDSLSECVKGNYEKVKTQLQDIINEEREHVGEFQQLINEVDPVEGQKAEEGKEEVTDSAELVNQPTTDLVNYMESCIKGRGFVRVPKSLTAINRFLQESGIEDTSVLEKDEFNIPKILKESTNILGKKYNCRMDKIGNLYIENQIKEDCTLNKKKIKATKDKLELEETDEEELTESYRDEYVTLEYSDLHISGGYGPVDWETGLPEYDFDDTISYSYDVKKERVIDKMCYLLDDSDFEEEDEEKLEQYVRDNFDTLFDKYHDKLLDYFRDEAEDEASDEAREDYNNYYGDDEDYEDEFNESTKQSNKLVLEETDSEIDEQDDFEYNGLLFKLVYLDAVESAGETPEYAIECWDITDYDGNPTYIGATVPLNATKADVMKAIKDNFWRLDTDKAVKESLQPSNIYVPEIIKMAVSELFDSSNIDYYLSTWGASGYIIRYKNPMGNIGVRWLNSQVEKLKTILSKYGLTIDNHFTKSNGTGITFVINEIINSKGEVVKESINKTIKESIKESKDLCKFIVENKNLYNKYSGLRKNLAKRIVDNTFNESKAIKSFESVVVDSVKYFKENNPNFTLTENTKTETAKQLLEYYKTNMSEMATKIKEQKKLTAIKESITDSKLDWIKDQFEKPVNNPQEGAIFQGKTFYSPQDKYISYLMYKLNLQIGSNNYSGWLYNDEDLILVTYAEGDFYITVYNDKEHYLKGKTEDEKFYKEN